MDLFEQPTWNFVQTLGGLHLRDKDFVRSASDAPTDETLAQPNVPSVRTRALAQEWAYFPTAKDAERELILAIQGGTPKTWGVANEQGDLVPIEPIQ